MPESFSQIGNKFIILYKGAKILFLLLFMILFFSCFKTEKEDTGLSTIPPAKTQYIIAELSKLFADHRYFEMKDLLNTPGLDYNNRYISFYRACTKFAFDETDSSIILFEKFLSSIQRNEQKMYVIASYDLQAFNYSKVLKWEKSVQLLDELLTKYPEAMTPNERSIIVNRKKNYSFDLLAKTSFKRSSSGFEMNLIGRDPKRIAVRLLLNGIEGDFILDTGAEVNSIPEKNVKKFGIREFQDTIFMSIQKGKRGGRTAIADNLALCNLDVKNVPFLIYPDEDLTIYSFDGIIGYPMLRQLGKIQINFKDMKISSSEKDLNLSNQNFCYTEVSPVIRAVKGEDTLCFAFDTGAYWTLLHNTDYTRRGQFQFEIINDSSRALKKFRGVRDMSFEISNKEFKLKDVPLLNSPLSSHTSRLDGIFGVEAIKNYNLVYIDFRNLIIEFD